MVSKFSIRERCVPVCVCVWILFLFITFEPTNTQIEYLILISSSVLRFFSSLLHFNHIGAITVRACRIVANQFHILCHYDKIMTRYIKTIYPTSTAFIIIIHYSIAQLYSRESRFVFIVVYWSGPDWHVWRTQKCCLCDLRFQFLGFFFYFILLHVPSIK